VPGFAHPAAEAVIALLLRLEEEMVSGEDSERIRNREGENRR
jgi:hypothetical protein